MADYEELGEKQGIFVRVWEEDRFIRGYVPTNNGNNSGTSAKAVIVVLEVVYEDSNI